MKKNIRQHRQQGKETNVGTRSGRNEHNQNNSEWHGADGSKQGERPEKQREILELTKEE